MNAANIGTSGACLGLNKGQPNESCGLCWQDPKPITAALSNLFMADGISQTLGATVLCRSLSQGRTDWDGLQLVMHSFSCTAQLIFSWGPLMSFSRQ